MSIRIGNPQELTFPTTAIGGGGRILSLGGAGNQWVLLTSIFVSYVASATVGNRVPVIRIQDAAGAILWQAAQGGNITAGQSVMLAAGGGLSPNAVASPAMQYMPLPDGFCVPANSNIIIFDNASISASDTVAVNIVISN